MSIDKQELQIALDMENNLVLERKTKATIRINSSVEKEVTIDFFLKSEQEEILSKGEKKIQLKKGENEVSFTMGFAPETANLIKKGLNLQFKSFNQQKKLTDFLI